MNDLYNETITLVRFTSLTIKLFTVMAIEATVPCEMLHFPK